MNISFDINDVALRCCICNKPLSVPPILHDAALGNICGRCEDRALSYEKDGDSTLERQRVYENIAKYLTFPCCYQVFGCTSELTWDSVCSHEDGCEFKNIVCPLSHQNFNDQCNWIDDHIQLVSHIKKDHKQYFSNPPKTVLTQEFKSKVLFSEIAGRIIIIILDYKRNLNKYYCCISADLNWKDCQKYQYQVEILSKQWDNPVILRKDELQPLYGNTSARSDNSLEIDIDTIKHLLERSDEINISFNIVRKDHGSLFVSNTLAANVSLNRTENSELNEEILHDLECPVCVEFMVPPIFICQAGHNVCNTCNGKINMCPICRGSMLGGRNFTLEKLTATINYPCMNREYGCGFVAPLIKVKQHENNCLLSARNCLVEHCQWKGPNISLFAHVEECHDVMKLNAVNTYQLQKKIDHYIISYDNKIFILNIRFDINQPFEYNVQCVGGGEVEYKHELQIIGSSAIDIKITLCHLCQPLPYNSDKKKIAEFTGISIPFAFLSQFLTHFRQLEFKLNIKRMKE